MAHWKVIPDIVCVAKALAGGMAPIGATIANVKVMDWAPGAHASTFGGNLIACAAALEGLNILEKHFLKLKCLELTDWSNYEIRKHIISNVLYGVDIETEAIRNTKYRLLLMLTDLFEDTDDDTGIPIIDSNYRIGNAIIGFVRRSEIKSHDSTNLNDCFYNEIKSVFQSHKDLRRIKLTEKKKKICFMS